MGLTITMHPRELAQLEARAASREMSLTAYVAALLDSDPDDVAPKKEPARFSLASLAAPDTVREHEREGWRVTRNTRGGFVLLAPLAPGRR